MVRIALPGGIGRVLALRGPRLYLGGNLQSNACTWASRTAFAWLTWELTHSSTWLGLMVMAEMLPMVLLAPAGGSTVDRYGALRCTIISQAALGAAALLLAAFTFAGLVNAYVLLAFAFLQGSVLPINNPSHLALIGKIVPTSELRPAVALQSAIVQTSRFIGPAIAGLFLNWGGAGVVFLLNGLSFFVFLIFLYRIPMLEGDAPRRSQGGLTSDFVDAVRYARGHEVIGATIAFSAIYTFLIRSLVELMPAFADQAFQRGSNGLAWLLAVQGVGSLVSAVLLAARDSTRSLGRVFTLYAVISAVVMIAFVLDPEFWTALVLIAVYGFASSNVSICSQTIVQAEVDQAMRARVMGMLGLTFRAVPAAGALVMGWVVERLGLSWPFVAAALACLACAPMLTAKLRRA